MNKFEVNGAGALALDHPSITGGPGNALTKTGTGELEISGSNSYEGPTIIKGGRLLLAGDLYGTARVEVQSGATLAGYGSILTDGGIDLLAGGKLSPGNGLAPGEAAGELVGDLRGGEFDISLGVAATASQALLFDLGTPGGLPASDHVGVFGGPLNIGTGGLAFDDFVFTALSGFGAGTYTLFESDSPVVGSFDSNVVLTVTPEPGTLALLLGTTALLGFRRRPSAAGV